MLKEKLKGQNSLLLTTFAKQDKFKRLVNSLRAREGDKIQVDLKNQTALFKHLVDLESAANPERALIDLMPVIEDDYSQILDFFFGQYQKNLRGIIEQSGTVFLMPDEVSRMHEEEQKGQKEKSDYLLKTVSPRFEPLWFFVVSLCRALQEGEYPMAPEEAYWAGLTDEVVGQNLPCMRIGFELLNVSESPE